MLFRRIKFAVFAEGKKITDFTMQKQEGHETPPVAVLLWLGQKPPFILQNQPTPFSG